MSGTSWRRYLRFFGPNVEADVDNELRFHLEARIAEYEKSGMTRAEAEGAAKERFGDLDEIGRRIAAHDRILARRARWSETADGLWRDITLSFHGFRRAPAYS